MASAPAPNRINKLAPGLTGTLSPEARRQVEERLASGALSAFACPDAAAIRREPSERDLDTCLRPAYVRDAEKIVHLPSYNRLAGKTQVFSFRSNDDLCRRGLHVQLVARVSRDIGRALGLNLDLIEAIALGHDIGHTPFGHAGERFLNDVYRAHTGRWFFHNVQSARVLDQLSGRNVSLQTLDGALCHNGEFEQQVFEVSDLAEFGAFDQVVATCLEEGNAAIKHLRPMTLEGCVVRLSDIIAYVGKDRQDAIRADLCTEGSFDDGLGGAYNAWALSAFVADVVEHSVGRDRIALSAEGFAEMSRAKRENYEKIYGAGEVNGDFSHEVADLFEGLYEHELAALSAGEEDAAIFSHHIRPLERRLAHYGRTYDWQADLDQTVVDFIAAMTDDYFMATCEAVFPGAAELFPARGYFSPGVRP